MAKHSKARKTKRPPGGKESGTSSTPAASGSGGPTKDDPQPRIPTARTWIQRLLLAVLVPVFLLTLVEGGLRLAGYGYPTDMFLEVPGRGTYGSNLRFGWRFFPRAIARSPQFVSFPVAKSPDTYRIFVLGASAAFGYPDAAFSFARFLEVMLRDQFPEIDFEVVNTSMVAINSHVVLPIARECAQREADLFVVYLGNNEVIGPYGVGSSLTGSARSLAAVRLGIELQRTRIGQLLQQIIGNFSGREQVLDEWGGMQMFAENEISRADPRLQKVYDHYRQNLEDIRRVAQGTDTKVIFSTVATNVSSCAPFASLHRADLDPSQLERWELLYAEGVRAQATGDHVEALTRFREAGEIDDEFADLHFRMARSQIACGEGQSAREHFVSARELDGLRFRADSQINEIVRRVAATPGSDSVRLVDAERLFDARQLQSSGSDREDLFYEHVHLTVSGNYLLARTIFPQVVELLRPSLRTPLQSEPVPPSYERCVERLVFTEWNEYQMLGQVMTLLVNPPFTRQLDHEETVARAQERLDSLRQRASPEIQRETYRAYAEAVRDNPDDILLRINYTTLLRQMGDPAAAEQQWQLLLQTQPSGK